MALPTGTVKNADGLVIKYPGQYETSGVATNANRARFVNSSTGPIKMLEMDIDLKAVGASATYFPFDLTNDGTRDGFSMEDPFLPQGCAVTRVTGICTEVAVGGTDFTVGTYTETGSAISATGLVSATEGVIANLGTVGEIIIGNGALVGDTSGTVGITANSWIAVTTNGTFSAGKLKLLIEYVATNV